MPCAYRSPYKRKAMEKTLELWPSGPVIIQRDGVFPLGMDSVLLADFARSGRGGSICELGCGCAAVSVLLALAFPDSRITALDISPDAAKTAAENARRNGLDGRIEAVCADMRAFEGGFDMIVCNPPYFEKTPRAAKLEAARSEARCTLGDVCAAAARCLRRGGELFAVYRPERLAELFLQLRAHGLAAKRLRFVHHSAAHAPSVCLVMAKKGAKEGGLGVMPPLMVCDESGENTKEFRHIYRMEEV